MDFLFSSPSNRDNINKILNNTSIGNTVNVIKGGNNYIVYKQSKEKSGTINIQKYLSSGIYKNEKSGTNPYIQILNDFNTPAGTKGAGLKIKAGDLVYLRDLGVYPINRMAILRRFPIGCSLNENLEEMTLEPISTVVGWLKPDQNFGDITFQENWTKTTQRFDQKISEIIKQYTGGVDLSTIIPIPDFAQGVLFEIYKGGGFLNKSGVDEDYEYYDSNSIGKNSSKLKGYSDGNWGLNNIPVGDPNVLQEGPFRDPSGQNISSDFTFDLTTTYEQKLLGDVDPGSAMLDILDNLYTMGTSNMVFYWGDNSKIVNDARTAAEAGNSVESWWIFVQNIMVGFWEGITGLFDKIKTATKKTVEDVTTIVKSSATSIDKISSIGDVVIPKIVDLFKTILTSTVAIHRFELRGTIELMVGGAISSTPWYLTLGNPYAPWIATNHIIVTSAKIETSKEMGFNDQPQWLTATFSCKFSRSLGKQELMRMFNNTYRRTYSSPSAEIAIDNKKNTTTQIETKSATAQLGLKKQTP